MKCTYDDKIKVLIDLRFIAERQQKDEGFMEVKNKYPESLKETPLDNGVKLQLY